MAERENNRQVPNGQRRNSSGPRHAAPSPEKGGNQQGLRSAPSSYAPPHRRRRSAGMIALIVLTVVMVAVLMGLVVGFTYANRVAELDTIYPNVSVNGIDVGGMTVAEAAAVLGEPADLYESASILITFPTGENLTVTAQQLGLEPADGTAFAKMAYQYGRNGTMLSNLMDYRACESKPVALTCQRVEVQPDREVLRTLVEPAAARADQELDVIQADYGQDSVALIKNPGTSQVDVEALCDTVCQAFQERNYAPVEAPVIQVLPEGDNQENVDVDELVRMLCEAVYQEPVDAQYDPSTGVVTEGVPGVHIDPEQAASLWKEASSGESVIIPYVFDEPEVTAEEINSRFFADVLSEKSTSLAGSSSARINNITLAAKAMNGVILQPGQEFNYNACLGERTTAKGYQSAGAYANGEHVQSVGGGICQGSSTLYYCALYANLQITARYDHYFLVSYLPRGLDATVSWGWPDFKFINNRNYPIKIEAFVSGGYLTVRLYGTDEDGSYVEMAVDSWEDSQYYYAQSYRKVFDSSGNLLSQNAEAYSRYHKEGVDSSAASATQPPAADPQVPEQAPVEPPPVQPETIPESAPLPEAPPEAVPEWDDGTTL